MSRLNFPMVVGGIQAAQMMSSDPLCPWLITASKAYAEEGEG